MNFLDHTLPEIAQNYLAELARLSARQTHELAVVSEQLAGLHTGHQKNQTQIEDLLRHVEKLENRLTAAEIAKYGYVDNGNETITDTKSGLMWKKHREPETYFWDDAIRLFNNPSKKIEFAGFSDWHLPTIDELKTLIIKNQSPAICTEVFPDSNSWFWSSSQFSGDADFAWGVSFYDGNVGGDIRYDNLSVRLVRTTQ